MKYFTKSLFSFIILIFWLAGIVLASHGNGNVVFSVVCPPYSLYLVVEKAMQYFKII